jgi:hypothetical protein
MACNASPQCGTGKSCCGNGFFSTGYQCQASCAANSPTIGCNGPSDCAKGQVCCQTITTGGGNLTNDLACAATCTGTTGTIKNVVCTSNADCPQSAPTCGALPLLQGFRICR